MREKNFLESHLKHPRIPSKATIFAMLSKDKSENGRVCEQINLEWAKNFIEGGSIWRAEIFFLRENRQGGGQGLKINRGDIGELSRE